MQATHFIELYQMQSNGKVVAGSIQHIENLEINLNRTYYSDALKTIAVWKIKQKPQAIIATHDQELNTTIIQPA